MHTEVFNNIDTLINMANSPLNIDEINTELITLNRNIKNKRLEIEDLKSLMTENRYFNASNELVDKNIEISLKNKINHLNRKIKEIKTSLDEIKDHEKKVYKDITSLKDKLNLNSNYVETLENKVKTSTSNEYYTSLLNKEQENIQALNTELEEKNTLYNNILKELELNNQAYNELTSKLTTEKNRLNDVLDNLENPNAYLDEDLKKADEEKLNLLTEDLEKLENRRVELLTSANMVGADAKELILNNNITAALNKIKELVSIIKQVPYMDITNPDILNEELEKKESMRNELATLIDNKNYEEVENNILNNRLNYIKDAISNNNKTIEEYNNKIKTIDEFVNNNLGPVITELEKEQITLEKSITNYHNLIKDKTKPSRIKANLENVVTKKEKERDILNDILASYKDNLLAKIKNTNDIANFIKSLENENSLLETELNKISKLSLIDFTTKDLAQEEDDKNKLKAINEEIKAIKNRQQFSKTPDEIFDEIDMYLSTMKKTTPKKTEPDNSLTIESLLSENNEPPRLKVVEMIPVETVKSETGGK